MATRFYLESTGTPTITPAFAAWDNTTGMRRISSFTTKAGSTMTTFDDFNMNSSSTTYFGRYQFICEQPLIAQTILAAATWTCVIRCKEEAATDDTQLYGIARCFSSDGGTLRWSTGEADVTEMSATALTGRVTGESFASDRAISAGDYIVFEVGYEIFGVGTDNDHQMSFGSDSATDLADTSTTANNPYFEISQTLIFGASTPQRMMTGCGT